MTLHQMQLFIAVCQYGSLSEAAKAVHISQPTFSVAIKQLEDEFGVSLFTRYKKRLVLTDAGEKFKEEANKILNESDALEHRMHNLGKVEPSVQVGVPAMSSLIFFSKYVVPFNEKYPDIHVEMHEISGIDALQQIDENQLHLAFVNEHVASRNANTNFVMLEKQAMVGVVRNDHPLANKTNVTLDMLSGEKLIFTGEKSFTTQTILNSMKAADLKANIFMVSHQFLLILEAIEKYGAISFFFEDIVTKYSNVSPFYFKDSFIYRHGLVVPKDTVLQKNEQRFLNYCTEKSIFNSEQM